jgi:hypothetical protein
MAFAVLCMDGVLIQGVQFKTQPQHMPHMNITKTKDEASGSVELLQSYPVVAAVALLEMGAAVISAVLSLGEVSSCHRQHFLCCEMLLPASVLLSYSVLERLRVTKCFRNSSGRFQGKGKAVPLRSIEAHLGDRRYSSCSFLTSALEGDEWSASRPGRSLPPGIEPRPSCP